MKREKQKADGLKSEGGRRFFRLTLLPAAGKGEFPKHDLKNSNDFQIRGANSLIKNGCFDHFPQQCAPK